LSDSLDESSEVKITYNSFIEKVELLYQIKNNLDRRKISSNRLVNECLFWALTIIEEENINISNLSKEIFINSLCEFLSLHIDKFKTENSHFTKEFRERYDTTANFFEEYFQINFDIYLKNSNQKREEIKDVMNNTIDSAEIMGNLKSLRLNKPVAMDVPIEEIVMRMDRKKFLIRPTYQRGETINKIKSSAIIESILLNIKLPPIFVYKRNDGISEVIDGQQRLLSILGFIGSEFRNEQGQRVKSLKHEYALTKLRILDDLNVNGKKYVQLSDEMKEKILDYSLYIVEIDEGNNPNFDPIDLFIRLNNKPFPIKENSFEMWNSYVDMDIINSIKDEKFENWQDWFYFRLENTRMVNEELLTFLAFFEYQLKFENEEIETILPMFEKGDRIHFRIKNKNEITKLLNEATDNQQVKSNFIESIKKAKGFIRNVKLLLIDQDVANAPNFLKDELDKLFNLAESQAKRSLQNFYALWYLLKPVNTERIKLDRTEIKKEIIEIIKFMKNTHPNMDSGNSLKYFKGLIKRFWDKYSMDSRYLNLNEEEKYELIIKQNNICPLCNTEIFYGQDIEVDHIHPLAIGGKDSIDNLQITHWDCNRKKQSKLI
jgi:hypothetical protein